MNTISDLFTLCCVGEVVNSCTAVRRRSSQHLRGLEPQGADDSLVVEWIRGIVVLTNAWPVPDVGARRRCLR